MSLISYTQLEDGEDASANALNIRFGQIVDEINGNIDSTNLANQAVTRAKIANGAIDSSKMATDRYIDDNGWTVQDFGTFKTYTKSTTRSSTTINQGQRIEWANLVPPVGRTRENVTFTASWYGGYSGHAILGFENSGPANVTLQLAHNWPAPLNFGGASMRVDVVATDKVT